MKSELPLAYELKAAMRKAHFDSESDTDFMKAPVFVLQGAGSFGDVSKDSIRLQLSPMIIQISNDTSTHWYLYRDITSKSSRPLICCAVYLKDSGGFGIYGWYFYLGLGGDEYKIYDFRSNEMVTTQTDIQEEMAYVAIVALKAVNRFAQHKTSMQAVPTSERPLQCRKAIPPSGWKYAVVKLPDQVQPAPRTVPIGTHASPRWHERRGHWRHLRSGRQVWVTHCEVGDKERGGVVHDYVVKP